MARIALVSSSYYPVMGGVSEHVDALAVGLARRGHGVTILTGPEVGAAAHAPWGVRRILRALGRPYRNGGDRVPRTESGVEVWRLGTAGTLCFNGGTVTLVGEPGLASGFYRIAPDAFDLVHVHSPLEPLLPLAAVQYFTGPRVGTFHSHGRSNRGYRVFRGVLDVVMRRLDARIAVSSTAARFVSEVFPGRFQVIPNGVDLSRFARARETTVTGGPGTGRIRRALSVGRLDARKGLDTVIRAIAQVARRTAGAWELEIVGDGPQRRALERLAEEERAPVRFRGRVGVAQLAEHYARADCLVAAATHGESFGVVLLEALAAGLPVVASDLESYTDVLEGSGAAVWFRAGDADHLAAVLRDLDAGPLEGGDLDHGSSRLRTMARNGRTHVAQFAWETVTDRIEEVYREVAGARLFPEREVTESQSTVQMLPERRRASRSPSPFFEIA